MAAWLARLSTCRRPVCWAALLAAVAACAQPAVLLPPSGTMDVLGPVPAPEPSALPADWVIEGDVGRGQLTVVERAGVPALMVVNGSHNFVAAKPTYASLLATPYLSWAWNMEPQQAGAHPVRLVIGFYGGDPQSRPWRERPPPPANGPALPPHDRALVIIWGESALQRGAIVASDPTRMPQPPARYTARGGPENARTWWLETVDLSDIYRRAWPGDDAARVQVAFIGVAAMAGRPVSPGYVSGVRLSR
ncbi:MAG: hypothetical protein A3B62_02260 [Rhodospirillales bacterium RIFCSPLOWO2_01_FULL_65_14]|nr:MAG: hypothetical protein A3B62_02260 [Rhodospirillales bacterium RIFCSPLOWO2_01_FULL_65_14]